jgi:amino acid transporter
LTAAAALGALVLLFSLMAMVDPADPRLGEDSGGLPFLVKEVLGEHVGTILLCDVVFAITVCLLAVHTATVRILFAMARDNKLPFAHSLARVSASTRLPIVPALLTGGLAILILLGSLRLSSLVDRVIAVSIVWANLAYVLVTAPLLVRRLRGWPGVGGSGGKGFFALGRWGVPVNVVAVVWGILTAVNMGWPREEVYGKLWYERYTAPLFTAALMIFGGLYYLLFQRHKDLPATGEEI